jgi:hypothetical protein
MESTPFRLIGYNIAKEISELYDLYSQTSIAFHRTYIAIVEEE